MEALRNPAAVRAHVGAVRRGPGHLANLYAAGDRIERWCAAETLSALAAERAVLLLRADRDFRRIYHVAEDAAALRDALAVLPAGTWVTDLIGQGDGLDALCGIYAASGFAPHSYLRRMVRVQTPGKVGECEGDATAASVEEAGEVAAFLDRLLDPLADQVPDAAELARDAAAGRLLLVRRHGGALLGILLYELKGAAAQLRFWYVDADAHGQGVGRRLMSAFLARCAAARRIVLWVVGDNDRSIAIYRHYGFATDGLIDRIMVQHRKAHA